MNKSTTSTRNWLGLALALGLWSAVSIAMSACGSSGSSSAPLPIVSPGGDITGVTCPTGQVYAASGCVNASMYSSNTYWGPVSGINRSSLTQMLTIMGKCNQYSVANWGSANCDTYTSQAALVVSLQGGTGAQATLLVGTSSPYSGYNAIQIQASGSLNAINNNSGYVINSSTGMQIYIDSADLTASTLPMHLVYQGGTMGTISGRISQ